jgi:cobalamin synthase
MGLAIAAYDSRVGFFAVAMVILAALLTCIAMAAYLVHFRRGKSENI